MISNSIIYNTIINKKIILIALVISFFSLSILPLTPLLSYDHHNSQRILQIIFLLVLSIGFTVNFYIQKNFKYLKQEELKVIPIFLLSGLASSIFSEEIGFALFYTFHISLLILAASFVRLLNTKKSTLFIIYALVIVHTTLTLVCLLNIIFTVYEFKPLNPFMIYSGFLNIRFFNQVQVFIVPFLILLLKFKNIQRIIFVILFLNLLLMFIGQARGALISFLVFSSFALILKSLLKKQILAGLVCLLLSWIAFITLDSLNKSNLDVLRTSSSGRVDIWLTTLSDLTVKNIFIGNGPGIFEISLDNATPLSHPHNSLIEILNEWGGIALLCILVAVFITFKQTIFHLKKHKKDIITESVFYSFTIGISYSLFSGVHVMPVSQTLLFIMWGLLIGRVNKNNQNRIVINKWRKYLITTLFIIAWYFYLLKAISIYNNINLDNGYNYGPRFWSVGQRF